MFIERDEKNNCNDGYNVYSVPSWGPSITSFFQKNEAELLYVEQMIPSDGDKVYIYWSGCNFYFGKRGGYAGLQHQNDNVLAGQVFRRNNICSIWDLADQDPSLPPEVNLTYGLPGLYSSHFGGEGTGLHTSHPMPWVQNQWYALVIRRWDNPVGSNSTGMAMFMYSYLDSKWTHYMSADVPGENLPITGNSCNGFIERFSGNAESYHGIYGKHFRMDKNGVWEKPTNYVASAGGAPSIWNAELYENENIKLSVGPSNNTNDRITLNPNLSYNKPKPVISPIITLLNASYVKERNIIDVSWGLNESTPPQLTFTVQIRRGGTDGE
ncbi:DUF3472 domain-containing protein, partial [Yersinia sp. 1252 StPb PI]|uniref:DUF3472 domain-containing protein n=1 Tax=Yersinia sp. 1252 StPb PI TaxID=3117404 RepID=UPI003B2828F5